MHSSWLLLCCCIVLPCVCKGDKVKFQDIPSSFTENIFIYLVKGPNVNDSVKLLLEDGLTLPDYDFFNSERETVFYFHGWGENTSEESVNTIASAFLKKDFVNLVLCEYSNLVQNGNQLKYLDAVENASTIGKAFGQYLQQYIPTVQPLNLVHLISHSLGSQIMSKTAKTYGSGQLPWLTGLDPAGPVYNLPLVDHLKASDGVFVDIVHTDGGFYGDYRSIGTIDFFPNRGIRVQPYCKDDPIGFCSHHMSWRYYAESILNATGFAARRCNRSFSCELSLSLCSCEEEFTYIGYSVNKSGHGDFFLKTNDKPPFGKGKEGVIF